MPTWAKMIPYLRIENLKKPYPILRHITIYPIKGSTPPPWGVEVLLRVMGYMKRCKLGLI